MRLIPPHSYRNGVLISVLGPVAEYPREQRTSSREEAQRRTLTRRGLSRIAVPKASTPREAQLLGVPFVEFKGRPHGFRERQKRRVTKWSDLKREVARARAA